MKTRRSSMVSIDTVTGPFSMTPNDTWTEVDGGKPIGNAHEFPRDDAAEAEKEIIREVNMNRNDVTSLAAHESGRNGKSMNTNRMAKQLLSMARMLAGDEPIDRDDLILDAHDELYDLTHRTDAIHSIIDKHLKVLLKARLANWVRKGRYQINIKGEGSAEHDKVTGYSGESVDFKDVEKSLETFISRQQLNDEIKNLVHDEVKREYDAMIDKLLRTPKYSMLRRDELDRFDKDYDGILDDAWVEGELDYEDTFSVYVTVKFDHEYEQWEEVGWDTPTGRFVDSGSADRETEGEDEMDMTMKLSYTWSRSGFDFDVDWDYKDKDVEAIVSNKIESAVEDYAAGGW